MEMEALIDADIDRTAAARLLMRMQADLGAVHRETRKLPRCRSQQSLFVLTL
jgi:hypothetical protein